MPRQPPTLSRELLREEFTRCQVMAHGQRPLVYQCARNFISEDQIVRLERCLGPARMLDAGGDRTLVAGCLEYTAATAGTGPPQPQLAPAPMPMPAPAPQPMRSTLSREQFGNEFTRCQHLARGHRPALYQCARDFMTDDQVLQLERCLGPARMLDATGNRALLGTCIDRTAAPHRGR